MKKCYLLYDDSIKPNDRVKTIIGNKSFGNMILKREKMKDRISSICETIKNEIIFKYLEKQNHISVIEKCASDGIFFYFPAMFRNLEFYVGENTVKKMHGVFFRREQTINISSVQYITTAVCGLEGFCFIILNVYGGIMILPFLSHKNFRAILHELEHDVIRR